MRLSWYGDTGVAVFSIWQGGRCTGTFRLPVDELPRMVDTLRRGPAGGPAELPPGDPGVPGERDGRSRHGALDGAGPRPADDRDGLDAYRPDHSGSPFEDLATGYLAEAPADSYEADLPAGYPAQPPGRSVAGLPPDRPAGGQPVQPPFGGHPADRPRPALGGGPRDAAPAPAPRFPPAGPGYGPAQPEILADDPLGLGRQSGARAGYRDHGRPQPSGPYGPADGKLTDPGAAAGDAPGFPPGHAGDHAPGYPPADGRDYPRGQAPGYPPGDGRDYRPGYPPGDGRDYPPGGPPGYPPAEGRDYPPGEAPGYPPADGRDYPPGEAPGYLPGEGRDYPPGGAGGYLPADGRDYPPGGPPDYLAGRSARPAADEPGPDPYRSWPGPDSGAHSDPRGRPDDYPESEGPRHRHAPPAPRPDRR